MKETIHAIPNETIQVLQSLLTKLVSYQEQTPAALPEAALPEAAPTSRPAKQRGPKRQRPTEPTSRSSQYTEQELARREAALFEVPDPDTETTSDVPSFIDNGGGMSLFGQDVATDNPENVQSRLKTLEVGQEVIAQRYLKLEKLVALISAKGRTNSVDMGS